MSDERARKQDSVKRLVRAGTAAIAALLGLTACGGGGGGGGGGNPGATWTPGVFQPSSSFAAQCVAPRSGMNPATGRPFPDVPGTRLTENNWLRSWTHELYLWYSEVPDLNPANYPTDTYFELLKTAQTTASGRDKDRFHFTYPSDEWYALSQSGVSLGYGAEWFILQGAPPRSIVVAYVEPNSQAANAGIARGDLLLRIDGVDVVNGTGQAVVDTILEVLSPATTTQRALRFRDRFQSEYAVTLQPSAVTSTPVLNVATLGAPWEGAGYLLFNDHIATAESQLINAISMLRDAGVTDLVLDLRYNGGGYLDIASQLAYMIAGPSRTTGQPFERMRFSDKHPITNPVTGQPLVPLGFHRTSLGFSAAPGQALPTLNLNRVYVLTGRNTCSASESIINGLRGVDIEVIQIGSTTCGKPYGFYPADNCGTTYFSIQFQGENAKSFGTYGDGFSPANTAGMAGERVSGCSVADDFEHELGDPEEARLAAALAYRAGGICPPASGFSAGVMSKPGQPLSAADGVMYKSPLRENRILREL